MVTSALAGEGKSFTSINLALSIAAKVDAQHAPKQGEVYKKLYLAKLESIKGIPADLIDEAKQNVEGLFKPKTLTAEPPQGNGNSNGGGKGNGGSGGNDGGGSDEPPHEQGAFGPIFRQFRHDAQGAIAHLKQQQTGEAVAALYHPEVGDIDLVWGETSDTPRNKGRGLAKLEKWHPEVLNDLQGALLKMKVYQRHKDVIHLRGGSLRGAVKLTFDNQQKTWLLTAYDTDQAKRDARNASDGIPASPDTKAVETNPAPSTSAPSISTLPPPAPEGKAAPAPVEPQNANARHTLLNRARFRAEQCPASPWVFCDQRGQRLANVQKSFVSACTAAGLADFHIHDLRHTCAAWLVQAGVPLLDVSNLLRHASVVMTQRYAHLAPTSARNAVAKLAAGDNLATMPILPDEKTALTR
jgi:hypothetical protein